MALVFLVLVHCCFLRVWINHLLTHWNLKFRGTRLRGFVNTVIVMQTSGENKRLARVRSVIFERNWSGHFETKKDSGSRPPIFEAKTAFKRHKYYLLFAFGHFLEAYPRFQKKFFRNRLPSKKWLISVDFQVQMDRPCTWLNFFAFVYDCRYILPLQKAVGQNAGYQLCDVTRTIFLCSLGRFEPFFLWFWGFQSALVFKFATSVNYE